MASSVSATAMMRGHQGDLVALEAVGIAVAIHVLVVQLDAGQHVLQLRDRAHDVGALGRMLLHDLEFFGRERAGLLEDAVVHADLADVVQQGGDAQAVEVLGGETQLSADEQGIVSDAIGMAARVGILFVDGGGEHADGAKEEFAVFLGGLLQLGDIALDVVGHVVEGFGQLADFRGAAGTGVRS